MPTRTAHSPAEFELYAGQSRIGRIVPVAVAVIGAGVIVLGTALYAAGVIGAPLLQDGPPAAPIESNWEPNPEFSKALGVLALKHVDEAARVTSVSKAPTRTEPSGSLLPRAPQSEPPGLTVEPPVRPKPPEGTEDLPAAAEPEAPPSGYVRD
jgi:hypothetical protein